MYWCKQMSGKTILSAASPLTQSVEAVKQPEYVRRAQILNDLQAEREANAVGPIEIISSKGTYQARKKRTTFTVREVDATGKEIMRFEVWDQKTDKGYVWSCSCGKPDCRHIAKAKAVFFSKKKVKAAITEAEERPHVTFKPFLEDEPRAAAGVV